MKAIFVFSLVLLPCLSSAQTGETSILREISLPGGNIFGATLSQDSSKAYFQQLARLNGTAVPDLYSITISSVGTQKLDVQEQRRYAPVRLSQSRIPCGDMASGEISGELYICSGDKLVEILDPLNLETIRRIQVADEEKIRGFAVNERNDALFLLTERIRGNPWLEYFSIARGAIIQSIPLPVESFLRGKVIVDKKNHNVAVILESNSRSFKHAGLFLCSTLSAMECGKSIEIERNADVLFNDGRLFYILGGLGDQRSSCISEIAVGTTQGIHEKFCDPLSGVHFSAAVVGNKYMVGFIGFNKSKFLSETVVPMSSGISVWELNNHKKAATAILPKEFTNYLAGASLVGGSGRCFLAFQAGYVGSSAFIGTIALQ